MNKQDLIAAVADSSGLTKGDASKAVEAVFDSITGALKKGGEVRLVGFGTFAVSKRKASTGRNPRTGETMTIAASNQPKFKAGKALKDAVNEGWQVSFGKSHRAVAKAAARFASAGEISANGRCITRASGYGRPAFGSAGP